jgi:copper(I)-binding protein
MRLPWPAVVGGVAVAALGATGLIRGAVPQATGDAGDTGSSAGPIVVTGAYVRPNVPPSHNAAAYFTVYNTTGQADRLLSVESGAGADSVLHTTAANGTMNVDPDGAVVPARGSLKLAPGKGHVMIEQVAGVLAAGQHVNLELDFANAGSIDITATVVPFGKPAPTPSGAPS